MLPVVWGSTRPVRNEAVGERKRKERARNSMFPESVRMKPARFDLFALGTRLSHTALFSEEIEAWSDIEERVLGVALKDRTDGDYAWVMLARDKIGRFRAVAMDASIPSFSMAVAGLRGRIAKAVAEGDFEALGDQKDETNYPTDVLAVPIDMDPAKLHPHFRVLTGDEGRLPARRVIKEISPWLAPSDPHFVKEFQTTAFDQRLWEMYLWAAFRELGFDVTQPEAPDFLCSGPGFEFAVEATTVSPSTSGVLADHPNPETPEEMAEFLEHYMPMKFGSSLTSKLRKTDKDGNNYWNRGPAVDKPFVLAIADFHISGDANQPGSMGYTQSAIWPYLYGHRVEWEVVDGQLFVRASKIENHEYKGKVVETGFFDLPGAENISAVIFTNAGTITKFERMGLAAGFIPPKHMFFRVGVRYNDEPNAIEGTPFMERVDGPDYVESWSDELQVFFNPNAKRPLDPRIFDGVTQHFFRKGKLQTFTPPGTVLSSHTAIMKMVPKDEWERLREKARAAENDTAVGED